MDGKSLSLIFTVLSTAFVVVFAAWGISRIASSSVDNVARQPEAGGQIRGLMIIACALIEGVALFALVICFLAQNKIQF